MVTLKEYLKGKDWDSIPTEHQENITELLRIINLIREKWAKPMLVTSGYRSREDQIRIYANLFRQRGQDFDEKKIPWGSQHLIGAAVDISDPDGALHDWCKKEESWLKSLPVFIEEKDDQRRVHFQIKPFKSFKDGTIFFKA